MENNKDLSWEETHALNIKDLDDRFKGSLSERLERESENDAGFIYNIRKYGWSPLRGNKVPEGYSNGVSPINGDIKPLLAVSFPMALTQGQVNSIKSAIGTKLHDVGWKVLVLDAQQQTNALAFGINGQLMEAMPLDRLIELLEGLKRVKEAQEGIPG